MSIRNRIADWISGGELSRLRIENKILSDPNLINAHLDSSGIQMTVEHPIIKIFNTYIVELFLAYKATNYLEMCMGNEKIGNFIVTVQRKAGKTPNDFRMEAEYKLDKLLKFFLSINCCAAYDKANLSDVVGYSGCDLYDEVKLVLQKVSDNKDGIFETLEKEK